MKIRINGYARHGKDTVADMISLNYGLVKPDASRIIAEKLLKTLPEGWYPGDQAEQIEAAYQDRVNHRAGWYNFVTAMGPTTLCYEVMGRGDIYVGERRRESFEKTKNLFDFSIWVVDPRKPEEDHSSCDLNHEGHDFMLVNSGTLKDLEHRVDLLWAMMEGKMERGKN